MNHCPICLLPSAHGEHPACRDALFDRPVRLTLRMTSPQALEVAVRVAGKLSISGIQPKLTLAIAPGTGELIPVETGGTHLLKPVPQGTPYIDLPANEHVTMRLAALVGIDVPPCRTVSLADGALAYLVKRFDRRPDPDHLGPTGAPLLRKLHVEDFCQALELPPTAKEDGTAEDCVGLVQRVSLQPREDLAELYRRLVFIWWAGCTDMHLKNFSLMASDDERSGFGHRAAATWKLAPAYDLLSTRLYPEHGDALTLSIGGRRASPRHGTEDRLYFDDWAELAERCGLIPIERDLLLEDITGRLTDAVDLIRRSSLWKPLAQRYADLLTLHSREVFARRAR